MMGRQKNRQKKNAGSCWKVLRLSSSLLAMLESGLSTNALCSWVLKVWPGFKAKVQPALFFLGDYTFESFCQLIGDHEEAWPPAWRSC